jgi:hypothetical protein
MYVPMQACREVMCEEYTQNFQYSIIQISDETISSMNLAAVMSAVALLATAAAAASTEPTTAPLTEPTTALPDSSSSAEAVTVSEASEAQGLAPIGDATTMDSLAEVGAGDKVTQADSHDMVSSDAMQDEMSAHESSTNSEIALDEVTTSTAGGQARTEQV